MTETLAAEGGGLVAGVGGSIVGAAIAGRTVESVVPGLGTAAGAIGGLAAGGLASFFASKKVRDTFDNHRTEG